MKTAYQVIVIGGGQAGLAAGYHLQRRGIFDFVVLEASDRAVGSWPTYYDSLRLFSPARYSALPGLAFRGDPERYPSRREVIEYLGQYAVHHRLPITTNARVERVERIGGEFRVFLETGGVLSSRAVISATGPFVRPSIPHFPGMDTYQGQILHSAQYHSPLERVGQRVVVVGAGNSAVQIAVELAEVAQVTLATRTPIRFSPQRVLGRDFHFWLALIDRLPFAGFIRLLETPLVLDSGHYRAAVMRQKPDCRRVFTTFTPAGVRWSDGTEEAVDTVLFAIGFRPALEHLRPLGALTADGHPLHTHGVSGQVPGLYYLGLSGQRSIRSATLRGAGPDAAQLVKHLSRFLTPRKFAGFQVPPG